MILYDINELNIVFIVAYILSFYSGIYFIFVHIGFAGCSSYCMPNASYE